MDNDDYESKHIGYGNPPKANQFKPGQSGNPKGRPKKPKKLQHISEILIDALGNKVPVTINGKQSSISYYEATIRQLVAKSAQGDMKAIRALMHLIDRYVRMESAEELVDKEAVIDSARRKLMGPYYDVIMAARRDSQSIPPT